MPTFRHPGTTHPEAVGVRFPAPVLAAPGLSRSRYLWSFASAGRAPWRRYPERAVGERAEFFGEALRRDEDCKNLERSSHRERNTVKIKVEVETWGPQSTE